MTSQTATTAGPGETITPVAAPLTRKQAMELLYAFINQTRRVEAAWEGGSLAEEVNGLREMADHASAETGYDYDPTLDPDTPFYDRGATLNDLASNIRTAADLDTLLTALDAFGEACQGDHDTTLDFGDQLRDRGIELADLPTFGGEAPENTSCVWSWDETRLLVGEGDFAIVDRSDWR